MKKRKKFKKDIKNSIKKDPRNIIVPIISFLILIISSFTIGIFLGILLFILINCIYFFPIIKGKKEKIKKTESKKKKWGLLALICLFILFIIFFIIFFIYIIIKAPDFDPDALITTDPSIVLDVNGDVVTKLGTEQRITISYDEVSESLIDAILATEDSRFYEHKGVDWARFLKASLYQLIGKSEAGGASTLTMQLSKTNYTSTEAKGIEGIIRKFTDIYISMFKIEKKYTKEQILEFYINSHYLGNSSYGVEQASLTYFGKSAKDLNISESALIAGLFQAPARYNVYDTSEVENGYSNGRQRAEARRKLVLKYMLRHEYITQEEYEEAVKLTVDKIVKEKSSSGSNIAGVSNYQSFVDYLVDEIEKDTGYNPYTTTMTIYSTMNQNLQKSITDIMNGETYTWHDDVAKAGIAVTNVKTGAIAALGGGRNIEAIGTLNYATDVSFQIGSTAKPLFDYGPAIEYRHISTYGPIVDEPISYSDGTSINNWNGTFEGFQTIRTALKGSRNIPALKAFKANDKSNIIKFVTNLGLSPEIYSCNDGYYLEDKKCINKNDSEDIIDANVSTTLHEAHSIGGYNGESPLSMAAAYAAFANGGTYIEPYSYTEILIDKSGEKIVNEINKNKAMSEETAYMISDMLVTTAQYALAPYANINGIKYAAKTGTTNFDDKTIKSKGLPYNAVNDLWAIGFNTEYSIGLWYGYDPSSKEHHNKISSGQHSRLFQAVGRKVFTNKSTFTKPSGVVSITIESECATPMLPSKYTPSSLKQTELFVKGYEPTEVSKRFDQLDNVSSLNSTIKEKNIILSWSGIKTPEINTKDYLTKMYSKVFETGYLNSFISNRLSYIKNNMGTIGYNVYLKDPNGKLELIDFTTNNSFTYTPETNGEYIFVVKTAYSIFKDNMSTGSTTSISVNFIEEEIDTIMPTPSDETNIPNESTPQDNTNQESNNNSSNTTNNNN